MRRLCIKDGAGGDGMATRVSIPDTFDSASKAEKAKIFQELETAFMTFYYDSNRRENVGRRLTQVFLEHSDVTWYWKVQDLISKLKKKNGVETVAFESFHTDLKLLTKLIYEQVILHKQPKITLEYPPEIAHDAPPTAVAERMVKMAIVGYFRDRDTLSTLLFLSAIPVDAHIDLRQAVRAFCTAKGISREHEDEFWKICQFYQIHIETSQVSMQELNEVKTDLRRVVSKLSKM